MDPLDVNTAFSGSLAALRTFLEKLDNSMRSDMFERTYDFFVCGMDPMYPLEYCIHFRLIDKVKLLLEYGAPIVMYSSGELILNRTPIAGAVYISLLYRYPLLLHTVLDEAHRRDCAVDAMAATFRGCAETSTLHTLLRFVIKKDAHSMLDRLIDAGLDPERGAPARRPGDGTASDGYDRVDPDEVPPLNSGDIYHSHYWLNHVRSLFSSTERRIGPVVGYAAQVGALKCLQTLHKRCSLAQWSRMLAPGETWEDFTVSPLVMGFFGHGSAIITQFLSQFHSPGGSAGPDLVPLAHEDRAFDNHADWIDVAALRAERDKWDPCTRINVVLSLTRQHDPIACAFGRNAHQALAVLVRHSRNPATAAAKLRQKLWYAPSAKTVEAALQLLVADAMAPAAASAGAAVAPAGVAAASADGAALPTDAAAALASDEAVDADLAALRQRIVTVTCPWSAAAKAARGCGYLKLPRFGGAFIALLAHQPTLNHDDVMHVIRGQPDYLYSDSIVPVVRALLEYDLAVSATPARLRKDIAAHSWSFLSYALEHGALLLAQLFVEYGADVFAAAPSEHKNLLSAALCRSESYVRTHSDTLPAVLASTVEPPSATDGAFASADAARAHAAIAAAQECSYLAALLAGSQQERPAGSAASLHDFNMAISLRWVWQRMYDRSPVQARKCLTSRAEPLTRAVERGCARSVRFLASLGARLSGSTEVALVHACQSGKYELAWALLDALPASGSVRARVLRPRAQDTRPAADAIVLAAQSGHCFSPALADAIIGADGGHVCRSLVHALCGPVARNERTDEAARALRFVCEKLSLSTPLRADKISSRSPCVIQ